MTEHVEYPKWLYHATQPPTCVASRAAHEALGPGWAESPDEAVALAEPPKADTSSRKPAKPERTPRSTW